MQDQNESLLDIVALLYKWKKSILATSLIAAIITAGISLLLPNYYEASTQFYAASPDLAQPSPLGNLPDNKDIFGNDHDIDRLFTIANSNQIQNFLIDEFDLYNHYKIDSSKAKAKYKLLLKLNKLYETSKTKYDAIRLSVEDVDPKLATDMANAARNKIDELAQTLTKSSQSKLIESYKASIMAKQKKYDTISDSLLFTRKKYNIFNTQSQGEAFGTNMVNLEGNIQNYNARIKFLKGKPDVTLDSIYIMEAKLSGFKEEYRKLKENINEYNAGYPSILKYERELKDFGDQLNLDIERLKQLEATYNAKINSIHIVELAEKPVIKSRPKRSLIVIGVAILTFVLMSLWVIVMDQFKKQNWRSKFTNG